MAPCVSLESTLLLACTLISLSVQMTEPGFLGCYTDDRRDRVFPGGPLRSNGMTISICLAHCRQVASFRYAGLQGGTLCYCGSQNTDLTKHGKKRKDGDCRDACAGNRDEFCGRSMGKKRYLSVYDVQIGICPDPGAPANGNRDSPDESFHFGSSVSFSCDVGYELDGPYSIQCVIREPPRDVMWSNSLPKCTALETAQGATTETVGRVVEQDGATNGKMSPTAATSPMTTPTGARDPTPTGARDPTPTGARDPTPTENTLNQDTETAEDMNETQTTVYCSTCPDPRNDSRVSAGGYVGLALGSILFIVCACLIVVCLLRGGKRMAEKAVEVAPSSGNNFSQHSAVYGSPEYRGDIPLREIRQPDNVYWALNRPPIKCDVEAVVESRKELGGINEDPYLELVKSPNAKNAVIDSPKHKNMDASPSSYSSAENKTDTLKLERSDVTPYVTIEDGGDEGRLSAICSSNNRDRENDEHYYSYADSAKAAESLYTYADSPRSSVSNLARNDGDGDGTPDTDYFVIEEKNNTMGAAVYNAACGTQMNRDTERVSEDPYTYADPVDFGFESS